MRLSRRDLGIKGTSFLGREQAAGGTVHASPTPSRLRIGNFRDETRAAQVLRGWFSGVRWASRAARCRPSTGPGQPGVREQFGGVVSRPLWGR
jgi:hypothetical protein